MSLIDDFNQLKLGVVGTKTSNIDKKLDLAVKDILQYKSNAGRLGYIDLMKNIITKSSTSALTSSSMGNNLFNQVAVHPHLVKDKDLVDIKCMNPLFRI